MNPNPLPPPEQTERTLDDEARGVTNPMLPIAFYICGTIVTFESFLISPFLDNFFQWFPRLDTPFFVINT